MLFVLRLIEFTHQADGERQTPDTEVKVVFFFKSFFASAIFIPAIPSCPLVLKSLQLLNIASGERTERDAWGPLPPSSRFRSEAHSSAGRPLRLLSKLCSGMKKCLRRERGSWLALWSGCSPAPYLDSSVPLPRRLARSPSLPAASEDRGGRSLGRLQGGWESGEAAGDTTCNGKKVV